MMKESCKTVNVPETLFCCCDEYCAWCCRHCKGDWLSWRAQVALRLLLTHSG